MTHTPDERLPRLPSLYMTSDRDGEDRRLLHQLAGFEQAHQQMTARNHTALIEQEDQRQEAFAQLNPDFGVLPDARHPDQHRFAQQRERALALGERVAAAEQSTQERGEPSDTFWFPRPQAPRHTPAERATDQRAGTRQRLLESFQRRQTNRAQRATPHPDRRSARTQANPAEQERER